MKCILHIGTEKTGTTSVQRFFFENRAQLKANGYYLLDSIRQPDNRFLAVAAVKPSTRDGVTKKVLRITTDEEMVAFQERTIANLTSECKALPKNAKVLISNEHLQSRLRTQEDVERLRRILEQVGFTSFDVIVYLRDPADTACSLYSTMVKGGRIKSEVPRPNDFNVENICHHQNTLQRFSTVFGKDYLHARLFRKDKLFKQSVVHDIAKIIGLDIEKDGFILPEKQNESLSFLGIQLLTKLNSTLPVIVDGQVKHDRDWLVYFIGQHFSTPPYTFTKEHYATFDDYFKDSNQWVRENYFPEEPVLFPAKRKPQINPDISESELESMANVITDIWTSRNKASDDYWYKLGQQPFQKKVKGIANYFLKRKK